MSDCIFCKIIAGEIPSMRVYEDNDCIASMDIGPASPGHVLVIPKKHYTDITEVDEGLLGKLFSVAKEIGIRQKARLNAAGFNIVQNNGPAAGQTVLHFHIHVIPRYENDGNMVSWNPASPSMDELQALCDKLK